MFERGSRQVGKKINLSLGGDWGGGETGFMKS